MKQRIFFLFAVLVFISCSKNPTEPNENETKTGTIRDIDGNVYQVVRIGKQCWMAENLKVTKYRNGEWIINVASPDSWSDLSIGAYCNYDNNFDNTSIYGNLYNWYAVRDKRNIAPDGWHVPTDSEWQELVDYLGGDTQAGEKMKSIGMDDNSDDPWDEPNEGATNESGFSALPGGYRSSNGIFDGEGSSSYFWFSTETSSSTAYGRYLYYDKSNVFSYDSSEQKAGYSIRCVKD